MNYRKNNYFLALILILAVAVPATASPQSQAEDDEAVVRITTSLVQVDVVVTDKDGRQVTDLKPEDFQIFEDGRAQKITNFSYISLSATSAPAADGKPVLRNAPTVAPAQLRADKIRRTIALVVDDLGLSFESFARVREAMKKFIQEQMQPGDLVAIIRTGGGSSALQQFTGNKQQLFTAIENLRWQLGRNGVNTFNAANPFDKEFDSSAAGKALNEQRDQSFTAGTLNALSFVVRDLSRFPGRKAVALFSDGFKIYYKDKSDGNRLLEGLNRLADLANRSSASFYVIDTRGVQSLNLSASDDLSRLPGANGKSPTLIDTIFEESKNRAELYMDTQNGLKYLAAQTSGLFTTDLNGGIKRLLEDQRGYYLLGYDPDDADFSASEPRKFHKITIKVKRPGLCEQTRAGFYGLSEATRPATPATRAEHQRR